MIEKIFKDSEDRMKKSVLALKNDLIKLRTGRAHTSLLEHIKVSYYGNDTPLSQIASIAVESARMLTVTPWEKQMVPVIEKAIITSDLGLNPVTAGNIIRVPLPVLTEERRKNLTKIVRDEAEKAKVAIRNSRRDANNELKDFLKDKKITEDESKRGESQIQKITDQYIEEVDRMAVEKEKELMAI